MNQLEMFRATAAHEQHDGFLYYAKFTPDLERRIREKHGLSEQDDIAEHFGMFQPRPVDPRAPAHLPEYDFSPYYRDMELPTGSTIDHRGVLHLPSGCYHFEQMVAPLRNATSIEELEEFPYPVAFNHETDHMADEVARAHSEGRPAVTWVGHMFEDAWQLRGMQEFLTDMRAQPEWAELILDKLTERNLMIARAAANAGVDFLRTGDDVATQQTMMFSPDLWRRFIKSRWARVYETARAAKPDIEIWYHSDGNIESAIPELIEIGVTILNPIQPECMDPVGLKQQYGDQLVFDGTMGTQTTMPFGKPDEIRQLVRERAETVGRDGALIFSPTHVLEPDVPIENVEAFVEAVREL